MPKKLLICIDYDQTYSADPELWIPFIKLAQERGHEVICVTMRHEREGKQLIDTIGKYCKIIYTARFAKLKFLLDVGISPDIWIDDTPFWIINDAGDAVKCPECGSTDVYDVPTFDHIKMCNNCKHQFM